MLGSAYKKEVRTQICGRLNAFVNGTKILAESGAATPAFKQLEKTGRAHAVNKKIQ